MANEFRSRLIRQSPNVGSSWIVEIDYDRHLREDDPQAVRGEDRIRHATALSQQRRLRAGSFMPSISYARHRFPSAVIRHAVSLYLRFTLSYRDVEELVAERGLDVSYESVCRWVTEFGPLFARKLRVRRPRPSGCWHLDEMAVTTRGQAVLAMASRR